MRKVDVVVNVKDVTYWDALCEGLKHNHAMIDKVIVEGVREDVNPPLGMNFQFVEDAGVTHTTAPFVLMIRGDHVLPPHYIAALADEATSFTFGPVDRIEPFSKYNTPHVAHSTPRELDEERPWTYPYEVSLVERSKLLELGGWGDAALLARWYVAYGPASVSFRDDVVVWSIEPRGCAVEIPSELARQAQAARLRAFTTVLVDFDDLCDPVREELDVLAALKGLYPALKVTLFTIPMRTTPLTIGRVAQLNLDATEQWIQLAPHGWRHTRGECLAWTDEEAIDKIQRAANMGIDAPVFKAPAWLLDDQVVEACRKLGYVYYDPRRMGIKNSVHGHLTPVCGNYIRDMVHDGRLSFAPETVFKFPQEVFRAVDVQAAI